MTHDHSSHNPSAVLSGSNVHTELQQKAQGQQSNSRPNSDVTAAFLVSTVESTTCNF